MQGMYVLISLKFSFVEATTCDTSSICNLQRIKKLLEFGGIKEIHLQNLITKKMVASLYNSTNLFKMRN